MTPEELSIPTADLQAVHQEVRTALGIPDANPVVVPIEFFEPQSGQWHPLQEVRQLLTRKDVPVKLRIYDSLFVPMAKWSMLLTGNYQCVQRDGVRAIRDAVHGDLAASADMYAWVDELARALGANAADQVPFEKYANAASSLLKPSSAARAIDGGAKTIERVDLLVQRIAASIGMQNDLLDETVAIVNERLDANRFEAPFFKVA